MRSTTPPNSAEPPQSYDSDFGGIFYPTHDNQYLGTWFRLGDGEAQVIEGAAPEVAYWSVSLQNRWMQSLDYDRYPVSLHDRQIVQRDGRYRVVVSAIDPGVDNWLDTAGHSEGLLSIRYQLAQDFETPSIRLVRVSDLAKAP